MAKDLIGYVSETIDSVLNRTEKEKEMQAALDEIGGFIDEQKKPNIPAQPEFSPVPAYERVSYTEKTDEALEKQAADGLSGYKASSLDAIEQELASQNDKALKEKESAKRTAFEKNESLDAAYTAAKQATDDDVLKRGLARSSIAVNKQAQLSDAKAQQGAEIAFALSDTVARLNDEIAALEGKREKALTDFNIAYAAKLTQAIQGLKDEQEKKKIEAVKYNNSMSEKEYAAALEKAEKEASVYGKELDNKQKEKALGVSQDPTVALYEKMTEVLDRMNGADARKLVMENALFRNHLTDAYYYKLYDRYVR